MLDCKSCVKRDVCSKISTVKSCIEKLKVHYEFQNLINNNMKVDINCNNYISEPKQIKGGNQNELC